MRNFRRLLKSRDGSTAMEYALIGVLISVAIVAALSQVRSSVGHTFNYVSNEALGDGTLSSP